VAEKTAKVAQLEKELAELKKQMAQQVNDRQAKDRERDDRLSAIEQFIRAQQPQTASLIPVRNGN
jgi:hypothetical protein